MSKPKTKTNWIKEAWELLLLGLAVLVVGEDNIENDPNVAQVVAAIVANLVGLNVDIERRGSSSFSRDQLDVDRTAPGDRRQ